MALQGVYNSFSQASVFVAQFFHHLFSVPDPLIFPSTLNNVIPLLLATIFFLFLFLFLTKHTHKQRQQVEQYPDSINIVP